MGLGLSVQEVALGRGAGDAGVSEGAPHGRPYDGWKYCNWIQLSQFPLAPCIGAT